MKVLLVNTYDRGGAANACIRLHLALIDAGHTSHLLTLNKTRDDIPFHFDYKSFTGLEGGNILNRVTHITVNGEHEYKTQDIKDICTAASKYTDVFSSIYSDFRIENAPQISEYDVVNLHWTSRFLNWPTFFASKKIRRVIWSLHDMAPFTGGYHYSDGFEGYKTDDSNPHFLRQTSDPDFAKKLLLSKQNILRNSDIPVAVISLSNWLHECATSSTLFKHYPIKRIANSVNTETYRYLDKREARKHLGLPEDKDIVLFISDSVNNKRKGFHLLEKAINKASNRRIMLCSVGKNFDSNLPEVRDFSEVHDEDKLALIYSAADVFVLPALEDNLPNVVIESLCCGTPVVGFNIGGMPDMIEDGVNGRLANDISAEGLLASLYDVLNNSVSKTSGQISQNARDTYSQSRQAEMFNLYLNDLRSNTSYRKP